MSPCPHRCTCPASCPWASEDPAARSRLRQTLLVAAAYANRQRDRQPLRSQDPHTTRYDWARLAGHLASAARTAGA